MVNDIRQISLITVLINEFTITNSNRYVLIVGDSVITEEVVIISYYAFDFSIYREIRGRLLRAT